MQTGAASAVGLSHCRGLTAALAPLASQGTSQETRGGLEVGRGITFPGAEEKHACTRLHTWLNSPFHPRDSTGIARTITDPLVFVFRRDCPANRHVQVVLLTKAPQRVWSRSCLCASSARSHPPSLEARLSPCGREQVF